MSQELKGKTALVTGANRGIGRAIVEELLERGAKRVYAGTRSLSQIESLVVRYGERIVPLQLDVTKSEEIWSAAKIATDVEILVNNAGVVGNLGSEFTDPAWLTAGRTEMSVNVFGVFEMTQAFAPVLAKNGGGAIINIGSVASLVNFPMLASYSMSKAAVHSLTQASRAFLKGQGTHVLGVYPGPVDTDMAANIEMEKTSPAEVAIAILDGLANGDEDVLPDPTSREMGGLFLQSPKALEERIASTV